MLATITWRPLHPADLLGMAVERSHMVVSHSDIVKVNGSGSVAAGQDVSVPVKRCHPGAVCKSGHSLNSILQWFGQMTPWCKRELREMAFKVLGGDLAKRLLGARAETAPRSLLAKPKNPNLSHRFWPKYGFIPKPDWLI